MRDSLMLSSLTVGEKQHPRLGGCVRVFFQLFDWNRRLSCKKRIFSPKQLPSDRPVRRAAITKCKDMSGETSLSNADGNQVLIRNEEEEDNLPLKLELCRKEEIIGGEGMKTSNDAVHEAVASPGFSSENESIHKGGVPVKSPGVIGKLMGLDTLPFRSPPSSDLKQKGSLTPADPSLPSTSSTVTPPQHDYMAKAPLLVFEHGLPDEELNALLAELNGNMCTIPSALPPHIGIACRNRPSSTIRRNSMMGVSSPGSCPATFAHTNMSTTSARASFSSDATQSGKHNVNSICRPVVSHQSRANLTAGALFPASEFPGQATGTTRNACAERTQKPYQLDCAQSKEKQVLCSRDDVPDLEQQITKFPRAGEGSNGGTIKSENRMKGKKSTTSSGSGKRLSDKSVNAGIDGASIDLSVQRSPQETHDDGRNSCKPARSRKVDAPMHQRLQEDVRGSPGDQCTQYRPLQEKGYLRPIPIDQPVLQRKVQQDAGVRGSPDDQFRCSLASRNAVKVSSKHDNFAIKYNVGFFNDYHKSRGKLGSVSKCKHSNSSDLGKVHTSKIISEAVADHDPSSSFHWNSAGAKEESSFIKVLINRREAREAAETAAMEAAGILRTSSSLIGMPAVALNNVESLQTITSSCNTEQLDNDSDRREKLSAGRSEAGGGDFIQVLRPITYGGDCSGGDACCVSGNMRSERGEPQAGLTGDNNDGGVRWWGKLAMGNDEGRHGGMCMATSIACTNVQVEICGTHAGSGKNTTAAKLQEVISALNGNAVCTPVSSSRRRPPHHHLSSDDGGSTPSTADGNETESTSESGGCWAAASQPSPVSVLISPFDDDVSPSRDDAYWIRSEDDYVAVLLAATTGDRKTNLPPAELFRKLEERVIAAWPDSEVPPTRVYRRLIFDCVCEALGQAVAMKDCLGSRRWRARGLFEEMCRWRQGNCDIVLDDLVEAEMRKLCNRWVAFDTQAREIAVRLERNILGLLVEELVCDLVLPL